MRRVNGQLRENPFVSLLMFNRNYCFSLNVDTRVGNDRLFLDVTSFLRILT